MVYKNKFGHGHSLGRERPESPQAVAFCVAPGDSELGDRSVQAGAPWASRTDGASAAERLGGRKTRRRAEVGGRTESPINPPKGVQHVEKPPQNGCVLDVGAWGGDLKTELCLMRENCVCCPFRLSVFQTNVLFQKGAGSFHGTAGSVCCSSERHVIGIVCHPYQQTPGSQKVLISRIIRCTITGSCRA